MRTGGATRESQVEQRQRKTRFPREEGLLRTQSIYLTQPHIVCASRGLSRAQTPSHWSTSLGSMLFLVLLIADAQPGGRVSQYGKNVSEYNTVVYGSYIDQVKHILESDTHFAHFKQPKFNSIFNVFFIEWIQSPHTAVLRNQSIIDCLQQRSSSHLLDKLPSLARLDSTGNPVTHSYVLPPGQKVKASPVLMRYVYELSLLERVFPGTLDGARILEIGGGFGGFAATVCAVHKCGAYTIVDLEDAGRLQKKYIERSSSNAPLHTIPTTNRVPVESDLLMSWFSISEQRSDVVDLYVDLYVAHARRGYMQLNWDEGSCGGAPRDKFNHKRYSVWQLWQRVRKAQPSAVLLPPPPCGVHPHYRLAWGLTGIE